MARVAELLAEASVLSGCEAKREAEVLLCAALDKPRSYLFAWPEAEVDAPRAERYRRWIAARAAGTPVAYLLCRRDFWTLSLEVDPATLIPRQETELLVELALALPLPSTSAHGGSDGGHPAPECVADLGTGSGAIALALATERPHWQVVGVDRSAAALAVAERNRRAHGLDNVCFLAGDWLTPLGHSRFALIASNPPYLASGDPHLASGDLPFEPPAALVAGPDGLAALREIVTGAPRQLVNGGWLLLEHGATQAEAVRDLLTARGFGAVASHRDLAGHERATLGCWNSAVGMP